MAKRKLVRRKKAVAKREKAGKAKPAGAQPVTQTLGVVVPPDELAPIFVNFAQVQSTANDGHLVFYQILPGRPPVGGRGKPGVLAQPVVRLAMTRQFLISIADAIQNHLSDA